MDPGEQTTGTRDEHYNLISVLYHALQGAENCNTYALDAEAAGVMEQVAFFREVGMIQAQLAERAKTMLGILEVPPEPGIAPEPPAGGLPPVSADVQAGEMASPVGEVAPTTDVTIDEPRTPPETGLGGAATPFVGETRTPPRTPPGTALPGGDVEPPLSEASAEPGDFPPDEDVLPSGAGAVAQDPEAATDRVDPEYLEPTISALQGGVAQFDIGQALAEIETWERRLEGSEDPELQSIAGNLGALRGLLTADNIDVDAAGPLLVTLGEQVQGVASSGTEAQVTEKLQRLSGLLMGEGRSLSG